MAKFFKTFCQNTHLKKNFSKKFKKKDDAKRMVQRGRKYLDVYTGMIQIMWPRNNSLRFPQLPPTFLACPKVGKYQILG